MFKKIKLNEQFLSWVLGFLMNNTWFFCKTKRKKKKIVCGDNGIWTPIIWVEVQSANQYTIR